MVSSQYIFAHLKRLVWKINNHNEIILSHGSRPTFLSLGTINVLGWIILVVGAVLCIVGWVTTSLVFALEVPVAWPSSSCDHKKCLHTLLYVSGRGRGTKLLLLRTTGLEEGKRANMY